MPKRDSPEMAEDSLRGMNSEAGECPLLENVTKHNSEDV
jgi:hypothetical protein